MELLCGALLVALPCYFADVNAFQGSDVVLTQG